MSSLLTSNMTNIARIHTTKSSWESSVVFGVQQGPETKMFENHCSKLLGLLFLPMLKRDLF